MGAPYKPREPGSLKRAIAQLVEICGGQKAVGGLLGCSAQHVARMTDDAFPKIEMRLGQVLVLERQCDQRVVTEYLAAEQGCVVEKIGIASHASLPMTLGRITAKTGELLSAAAKDMQAGNLTLTNAGTVLDETDDLIGACLTLRACARAVKQRGGN